MAKTVAFHGGMTVLNAEDARLALLAALEADDSLEIDCSDVDEVDLTFITSLLAARIEAVKRGQSLRLSKPAAGAVLDALVHGGFTGGFAGASDERAFWGIE